MAMSTTPLSPAHSGSQAGVATGELSDWVNRVRSGSQVNSNSSPAAMDFEEEVRQSRLNRQQRKKRLSNQGVSGIDGPATYDAPQSGSRPTSAGGLQMDTMSHDSATPARRGAALLSRYGGQAGPTGTANAGSGGSPVSLASFMGGRAAGPRLGKLAGDGRSAPPEAELIDDSRVQRRVALPGMSPTRDNSGAGRSLASFLEARATGREAAASPAAAAASFAPPSPTRASPTIRAASPTRGNTEPMAAPPTRQSPVRRSTSPSKRAVSPEKLSAPLASPITVPRPGYERALSSNAEMKHAATSPIKFDEPGVKSITPSTTSTPMATPRSAAGPDSTTSTAMSPAFAQLQRANSDRQPTPSLTRLQGKGMVGQRLKEAKQREAAASSSPSSGSSVPGRITIPRSQPQSPSKWGTVESTPSSPAPAASTSPERKWQRSGNALPGLSRPSSSSAGAGSGAFRSPSPTRQAREDDRFENAPPVRLPGMGGASSPFGASGGRAASPTKVATDEGAADKPLEHLTKSRAKGPVKRSARVPTAAAESTEGKAPEVAPAPVADVEPTPSTQSQLPPAPLRSTTGPRIAVLISGSGSNLQALIDATHVPQGPLSHAHISFVLSNRKAAYGLTRASTSNPPIPTEILALKTWQNRNAGGTREQYDEVLAKAVLTGGGGGQSGQAPDLIVLAGFMHIVSPVFLRALGHDTDLPNSGAPAWRPAKAVPIINLHPALPGAFDGANAIPRAFEAFQKGEVDKTGIMVHEVVAEVDRGAPVLVREVPIGKQDTLETLEEKMHSVEHEIIVEATAVMLQRIKEGTATPKRVIPAVAEAPTAAPSKSSSQRPRMVPLKRSGDSGSFAQLSRNAKDVLLRPRPRRHDDQVHTLSVETLVLQSDGSTTPLPDSEAHILYEDETQAIVHRFKSSPEAELAQTAVYARVGAQAKEAAKIKDVARRYGSSAQLVDARQGKEPQALALLFPRGLLETRRGASRAAWDKGDSMLWRVSAQLAGGKAATFVDQVELRTSSLTSASSFVLSVVGTVIVWHGRGAYDVERDAARRFARELSGNAGKVTEMEEGSEDGGAKGLWWSVLNGAGRSDEAREYAQAWHHRRRRAQALVESFVAKEQQQTARLLTVRPGTGELDEVSHSAFTSSDVPQGCVSLVVLTSSSDVYVLVGPDARGQRSDIAVALQAAEALQQQQAGGSASAAHVVVYPSTTPRDLAQAVRYCSCYEAGLRRGARSMNVVGLEQAKKELLEWKEVDERLLQDLKALPVGVDETEVL